MPFGAHFQPDHASQAMGEHGEHDRLMKRDFMGHHYDAYGGHMAKRVKDASQPMRPPSNWTDDQGNPRSTHEGLPRHSHIQHSPSASPSPSPSPLPLDSYEESMSPHSNASSVAKHPADSAPPFLTKTGSMKKIKRHRTRRGSGSAGRLTASIGGAPVTALPQAEVDPENAAEDEQQKEMMMMMMMGKISTGDGGRKEPVSASRTMHHVGSSGGIYTPARRESLRSFGSAHSSNSNWGDIVAETVADLAGFDFQFDENDPIMNASDHGHIHSTLGSGGATNNGAGGSSGNNNNSLGALSVTASMAARELGASSDSEMDGEDVSPTLQSIPRGGRTSNGDAITGSNNSSNGSGSSTVNTSTSRSRRGSRTSRVNGAIFFRDSVETSSPGISHKLGEFRSSTPSSRSAQLGRGAGTMSSTMLERAKSASPSTRRRLRKISSFPLLKPGVPTQNDISVERAIMRKALLDNSNYAEGARRLLSHGKPVDILAAALRVIDDERKQSQHQRAGGQALSRKGLGSSSSSSSGFNRGGSVGRRGNGQMALDDDTHPKMTSPIITSSSMQQNLGPQSHSTAYGRRRFSASAGTYI